MHYKSCQPEFSQLCEYSKFYLITSLLMNFKVGQHGQYSLIMHGMYT